MENPAGHSDDPRVLVTGAASGIGRAVASSLAEDGFAVTATDIDAAGLAGLSEESQARSWDLTTAVIDALDRLAMSRVCDDLCAGAGHLAAVVHCAGITWRGALLEMQDLEYERIVSTNLKGSFVCMTAAARSLVSQGKGGSIVAISSVNALRPLATQAVYSAAKAAVEVLVQTRAVEVGGAGVRVNAVAPGAIETPMNPGILHREELPKRLPLGREGMPMDIVAAVRFLISDAAGYITGTSLVVDGSLLQVRAI